VQEDTVRRRVKMLIHHLGVCIEFRTLQNYHALSAYVSGLGNASVIRLKHTKEALPKKWQKVWEEISDLTNMKSSFKFLREALLHGDPPKIPYMGVYLSDFTFIEDGNVVCLLRVCDIENVFNSLIFFEGQCESWRC
jgi:son of sevenless-like protein